VTSAIRDLIAEGRIGEIRDFIAEGRSHYGMQTFDQHLTDLVRSGQLAYEVALAAATRPSDFALQFRMGASAAPAPGGRGGPPPGASGGPGGKPAMAGLQSAGEFDFLNQ
jgi:twitching motility protein PilT